MKKINEILIGRYQVAVPLTKTQWKRLDKLDCVDVIEEIKSFNGHSVDYDGHFGQAIFMTFDSEDFTEETKEKLMNWVHSRLGKK
jgi:hypothetical protein